MNPILCKQFETQLNNLINNSQLTIVEAYYIVKVALLQLEQLYERAVNDVNNNDTKENGTMEMEIPLVEEVPDSNDLENID